MNKEQFIGEMLLLPATAIDYHFGQNLVKLFPDRALIEGDAFNFNVEGYAASGHCTLTRQTFTYNQVATYWRSPEPEMMYHHRMAMMGSMMIAGEDQQPAEQKGQDTETGDSIRKAWLEVQWQGHSLDVILLLIEGGGFSRYLYWILAESEEVARRFYAAVCKWNNEIRSEVLVFDMDHWHKDAHLFQDIKNATFDNLILRGSLTPSLRLLSINRECSRGLASRD
jgi:hypothetical protein